jgi:hypothetical protein
LIRSRRRQKTCPPHNPPTLPRGRADHATLAGRMRSKAYFPTIPRWFVAGRRGPEGPPVVSVLDLEVACPLAITQQPTPHAGTANMQPMCFSLNDVKGSKRTRLIHDWMARPRGRTIQSPMTT